MPSANEHQNDAATGQNGSTGSHALSPQAGAWETFRHRGKKVGQLSKDGSTFYTRRNEEVHFAYRWGGYGLQRRVLRDLQAAGVKWIRLDEVRKLGVTRFKVEVSWWLEKGNVDVMREGDGVQVFLTRTQLQRASGMLPPREPPAPRPEPFYI